MKDLDFCRSLETFSLGPITFHSLKIVTNIRFDSYIHEYKYELTRNNIYIRKKFKHRFNYAATFSNSIHLQ